MGNWEGLKDMGMFLLVLLGMFAALFTMIGIMWLFVQLFGINAVPVVSMSILVGFFVWGFMGDDLRAWWERRKGQQ